MPSHHQSLAKAGGFTVTFQHVSVSPILIEIFTRSYRTHTIQEFGPVDLQPLIQNQRMPHHNSSPLSSMESTLHPEACMVNLRLLNQTQRKQHQISSIFTRWTTHPITRLEQVAGRRPSAQPKNPTPSLMDSQEQLAMRYHAGREWSRKTSTPIHLPVRLRHCPGMHNSHTQSNASQGPPRRQFSIVDGRWISWSPMQTLGCGNRAFTIKTFGHTIPQPSSLVTSGPNESKCRIRSCRSPTASASTG